MLYALAGALSAWQPSFGFALQALIHIAELAGVIALALWGAAGTGPLARVGIGGGRQDPRRRGGRARAAARRVPALWGRAADADGAPPYPPWRQILRAVPDLARLAGELGVGGELALLVPELPEAVRDEEGTDRPGSDGSERFRLFDAVSRLLRAAAEPDGLVLVLDDVHRADQPSLLLLRHLVADLRGDRLLVLATHRGGDGMAGGFGETLAELVREPVTERVELTGLAPAAVASRLEAATGAPVAEAAGEGEDGLQIVAVWESAAHHDRFVAERLHPAFRKVGQVADPGMRHIEFEVGELVLGPATGRAVPSDPADL